MCSYPRIFLTWYAAPEDPRYWDYFNVPGIVVSLKSIFDLRKRSVRLYNRLFSIGFKKTYEYKGPLIIDSLTLRLQSGNLVVCLNQSNVLYLQYILGSDILVNKDYPLINIRNDYLRQKLLLKNIKLAELSIKLADKFGKEIMLIVQGWDLNSYLYCAKYYRDLGVKYIGIGSLVPHKNDPRYTVKIVKTIRSIVGKKSWIHVFGIAGWNILNKLKNCIDSIDTSTPIRAASNRELIIHTGKFFKRLKISSVDGYLKIRTMLNNVNNNIEYMLLRKILEAKDFANQRKYLALYNAYVMLKSYKQI